MELLAFLKYKNDMYMYFISRSHLFLVHLIWNYEIHKILPFCGSKLSYKHQKKKQAPNRNPPPLQPNMQKKSKQTK